MNMYCPFLQAVLPYHEHVLPFLQAVLLHHEHVLPWSAGCTAASWSSGPTLRRLYLPGLDPLKLELSRFELLLATHQPQLHQHLLEAGLPALLYAAQWLMTTYSCPFPVHVAARVLDVLLQSDSDAILPRLGLEVMRELQPHLLELDDFEALITYLKVRCLTIRATPGAAEHAALALCLLLAGPDEIPQSTHSNLEGC